MFIPPVKFPLSIAPLCDFPRFLTADLVLKLSKVPSLSRTIEALKHGFSLLLKPLNYDSIAKKITLLFTLPELVSAWLGQPWSPKPQLLYFHAHQPIIPCCFRLLFLWNTSLPQLFTPVSLHICFLANL